MRKSNANAMNKLKRIIREEVIRTLKESPMIEGDFYTFQAKGRLSKEQIQSFAEEWGKSEEEILKDIQNWFDELKDPSNLEVFLQDLAFDY